MRALRFKWAGQIGGSCAVILAMSVQAQPQPGILDTSFAGTGMTQLGFGRATSTGKAVAVQNDGSVVMAGESLIGNSAELIAVARFGTNNMLDPTFGVGGVANITAAVSPQVVALAIQPDGKILVAGTSYSGADQANVFMATRVNSDGSLDTSFGSDGLVTWNSGGEDTCNGMVLQPDGKIVLAGYAQKPIFPEGYTDYMTLLRVDTNGVPDPTFGSDGAMVLTNSSVASCVALQGNGDILVGGIHTSTNGVFRFTTNGAPDTSFGVGGAVALPFEAQVSVVGVQPGGISVNEPAMILAAGKIAGDALIARMSLAGTLDTGFNATGVVTQSMGNSDLFITGLQTRISGLFTRVVKILISGYVSNGSKYNFFAARFTGVGALDTTFGSGGIVSTSLSPGNDEALGLVNVSDLLLAGSSMPNPCETDFSMLRYKSSDGSLDTNFNGTGFLIQRVGNLVSEAKSVAIQADGKILVAGDAAEGCAGYSAVALCRYNADGTLDPAFGTGGTLMQAIGAENSEAYVVAIQPDNKIVIAGNAYDGANESVMVTRFLSNGVLDTSFATTGSVTTVVGTNGSTPFAMALQKDGKIVVGTSCAQGGNDLAVVRYNSNGSLDTTWNGTGKMFTSVGSQGDSYNALAVQADGKIVAAGYSFFAASTEITMFRCTTNGSLDTSFGSFGRVATQIGSGTLDAAFGLALQPNGRIVLSGESLTPPGYNADVAVVRYITNGTLDTSFGSGGKVTTPIGLAQDNAIAVVLQNDGKIVAGCQSQIGSAYKFAAARFLSNGTLDSGYGVNGVNYFDFGTTSDETANAIALDSIGRMVMAGSVNNVFGILRVTGDTTLRITSITRLANGHILLQGVGVPGGNHTLQFSATLGPANFAALGPVTADASGAWQYEDATALGAGVRFYRLSYP